MRCSERPKAWLKPAEQEWGESSDIMCACGMMDFEQNTTESSTTQKWFVDFWSLYLSVCKELMCDAGAHRASEVTHTKRSNTLQTPCSQSSSSPSDGEHSHQQNWKSVIEWLTTNASIYSSTLSPFLFSAEHTRTYFEEHWCPNNTGAHWFLLYGQKKKKTLMFHRKKIIQVVEWH